MTARDFKKNYVKSDKMNEIALVYVSGYGQHFMLRDDAEILEVNAPDYIAFYPVTAELFERLHQITEREEMKELITSIDLIIGNKGKIIC